MCRTSQCSERREEGATSAGSSNRREQRAAAERVTGPGCFEPLLAYAAVPNAASIAAISRWRSSSKPQRALAASKLWKPRVAARLGVCPSLLPLRMSRTSMSSRAPPACPCIRTQTKSSIAHLEGVVREGEARSRRVGASQGEVEGARGGGCTR